MIWLAFIGTFALGVVCGVGVFVLWDLGMREGD